MKLENGIGWEDAAALVRAVDVAAGEIVVTTTGSGDHILEILRHGPRLVIAADPRPVQTWLAELKLAAVKSLSHSEFLELLGFRKSSHRKTLYKRIRWLLTDEAAEYWDKKEGAISRGIVWQGRLERSLVPFRQFIRVTDGAEGFLWRRFSGVFYPRTLSARGIGSGEWKIRVKQCLEHNGPYNTALFEGQFDALPEAFREENFEQIKESANRVILVTDELDDYLPMVPDECVDAVILTESPVNSIQAWRQIFRAGKPGARIVSPPRPEDPVPGIVGQGAILEQDVISQRSFFDGSHCVHVIAKTGVLVEATD